RRRASRRARRRSDLPCPAEVRGQCEQRTHAGSALGSGGRKARRRQRNRPRPPPRRRGKNPQGHRRPAPGGRTAPLPYRRRRRLGRSATARPRAGRARRRRRLRLGRGGGARLRLPARARTGGRIGGVMLAQDRRQRLLAAMAEAGIGEMVLYGNAWQGDYLRYAADFGLLEGHGIAVVAADGAIELFLDSATEAERAEAEVPGIRINFAADIARAVGARLERVANRRLAAAPRRFLPNWLAEESRAFALEDGTAMLDRLLMHKLPAEIAVLRRAAQMADDAYRAFRQAVKPGRRQYELVADTEAYLR